MEAADPAAPPQKVEAGGMVIGQPEEEEVVRYSDRHRQFQDEQHCETRNRNNSYIDDDNSSKLPGDANRAAVDCGIAAGLADASCATGRAASILASDLGRLASRQGAAAWELLRVSSSGAVPGAAVLDSRKDPRKDPEVLDALATLGEAVGLQAKAVGLMEEVVVRTAHSRVSKGERD